MAQSIPHEPGGLYRVEHIMGMPVGIDLRDQEIAPEVLDRAFDWFRWVDSTFSTYLPDSEISRINRGLLTPSQAHPDVQSILKRCEELRIETGGFFDIQTSNLPLLLTGASGATVRSGIDPSGLVKGWSVDRAGEILDMAGARNYSINAGGDIRVRGGALPDNAWRVGIQHPLEHDKIATVIEITDLTVATSGAYARGDHIIDPHTGSPVSGVLSVSVVGTDLATADAYATALFAMGADGPAWTARLFGYEAMIILEDHTVLSTTWFPSV